MRAATASTWHGTNLAALRAPRELPADVEFGFDFFLLEQQVQAIFLLETQQGSPFHFVERVVEMLAESRRDS